MSTGGISLRNVTKVYSGDVLAVDDIDLEIDEGEFMVLVGPSGCGKSTLLRLIAGLEEATEGAILIGGKDVTELPPQERDIAMVFQNYALYPHMTVEQNLAFGLRIRKVAKEERKRRVLDAARTLGLLELLDRKPAALSGGQRQRVAIGRAMVREPVAFLMDEPLSNLDAKLRVSMRAALARLHEQLGVTTVYVTHDQVEAMTLGQRVAVLRDGRLQQVDTPQNLFNSPANLFVAAFIGSPSMNLVEADVSGGAIRFAGHVLAAPRLDRPTVPDACWSGSARRTSSTAPAADPALPRMRVRAADRRGARRREPRHLPPRRPARAADAVRAAADAEAEDQTLFADDERAEFTARVDSGDADRARRGGRARGPRRARALLRSADRRGDPSAGAGRSARGARGVVTKPFPLYDLPLDELERHRTAAVEPAGLDAFWAGAIARRALAREPAGRRALPSPRPTPALAAFDVTFSGADGDPVKAWYLRPAGPATTSRCRAASPSSATAAAATCRRRTRSIPPAATRRSSWTRERRAARGRRATRRTRAPAPPEPSIPA